MEHWKYFDKCMRDDKVYQITVRHHEYNIIISTYEFITKSLYTNGA